VINLSSKKGPSDQITNIEKKQISSRAKRFSRDLLDVPMGEGLAVYQDTIDDLYDGKARLRLCLKCGDIDTTANLSKDSHRCTMGQDKLAFPYLVTTSWLKMRDFFLGETYIKILQKLGFEPTPIQKVPVTIPSELSAVEHVEEVVEEPVEVEVPAEK
jgi:hypothetical protein